MADDTSTRSSDLTAPGDPTAAGDLAVDSLPVPVVPRRARRHGRTVPTTFGVLLLVAVAGSVLARVAVADSSVMGLVWAGLASVLVVGGLFPMLSVGLLRVRVVSAPVDMTVGELASVEVELAGRASGLMVRCGRSPMFVIDLTSPDRVRLPLEISRRGVYDHLPVEVSSDAPFSVVLTSSQRVVPLARRLLVGPRVIDGVANLGQIGGDQLDTPSSGRAVSGDTVRSVRPYVSGDPSHMVHWPSTARTGDLVVRELEPPQTEGVAVVLSLADDGSVASDGSVAGGWSGGESGIDGGNRVDTATEAAEAAVSRAAGVALNALGRGGRVMLCTNTAGGPVCEEVHTRVDVQRRLAVAVAGRPAAAPDGWPVQTVSERR